MEGKWRPNIVFSNATDRTYVNGCLPQFLHEQFASELAISRQHAYILRFVTAVRSKLLSNGIPLFTLKPDTLWNS